MAVGTKAAAQTVPPIWNSSATYATGDLAAINGNYYRALTTSTNQNPTYKYNYWELYEIRSVGYTVNCGVGQPFPDLAAAWRYVQHASIVEGPPPVAPSSAIPPTLHIHIIGNLNEQFTRPLNLDHPFGASIEIYGDPQASVNLEFIEPTPNSTAKPINGIVLDTGHYLNSLRNVNVTAVNDSGSDVGIFVDSSASINIGNVSVDNFDTAVMAQRGARLYCTIPAGSTNSLTVATFRIAVMATDSAFIDCTNVSISGDNNLSLYGLNALNHSEITAAGANIFWSTQLRNELLRQQRDLCLPGYSVGRSH